MRMWNVDPKKLCRSHLLGEHVEMHMFAGSIGKGISIAGYARTGLVKVSEIESRHNKLAGEILRRGYKHKSPINSRLIKKYMGENGSVDAKSNIIELKRRCQECRKLMKN